jgi:hypothetical protein
MVNRSDDSLLPGLIDNAGIRKELGVTKAAAEKIMRQLNTVQLPGLRKVYVHRSDVAALIAACTFTKDEVPD